MSRMSLSATSSSERSRPPKKRDFTFLDSSDDEEELLFGSPALRHHHESKKPSTTNTATADVETSQANTTNEHSSVVPKRKSPRRSSIATLDANSSASMDIMSQASTLASADGNSPSEALMIIDDDDDEQHTTHAKKKKKQKKNQQMLKNDDSAAIHNNDKEDPCDDAPSTLFTLTKATDPASKQKQSSSSSPTMDKPLKKTAADAKPKKKAAEKNTSPVVVPPTEAPAAARVSMSVAKKPKKKKNQHAPPVESSGSLATSKADACDLNSVQRNSPAEQSATKKKEAGKLGNDNPKELSTQNQSKENNVNRPTDERHAVKESKKKDKSKAPPVSQTETSTKSPTTRIAAAPKTAPRSASTTASSNVGADEKTKKKKKKLNFQDSVFQHMFLAMKPFNLKILARELQTTEAALNNIMLSLTDKGLVAKKEFTSAKGNTKTLYWAVDGVKSKEVRATSGSSPSERQEANQQLQRVHAELASLQKTLVEIQSDLSNEEIVQRLQQEEEQRDDLQQKIDTIRNRMKAPSAPAQPKPGLLGRKGPPKPPATPNGLKRRINHMRDEWKERKQKCMDFCDQLSDATEKKRKDVVKLLDLDTDEVAKVTLPAKYEVEAPAKKKR